MLRSASTPLAPAADYERHRPEETPLYGIIETYYPQFLARLEADGASLPAFVKREFDDYLKCGRLEHGFLRVKCDACSHEHLVAFSCKRRGFCPSCGARRMVESAAHLLDHVLPAQPIRQWVLTFPYPLRFLFAARPQVLGRVLGVVYRAISTHLLKRTGFTVASGAKTGAVTLIQRFGSALNLNIHFHMLFLDGAYSFEGSRPMFQRAPRPTPTELARLLHRIAQRVARLLERQGLLVRDPDRDYLDVEPGEENPDKPLAPMSWMQRLRRVFAIDIKTCPKCGGKLRVIACIEDPDVIATILEHIQRREAAAPSQPRTPPRRSEHLDTPNQDRLF